MPFSKARLGRYTSKARRLRVHAHAYVVSSDGSECELSLNTYKAARSKDDVVTRIVAAVHSGVPGRRIQDVFPDYAGASRSQVSRHWIEEGSKRLEDLRTRSLEDVELVAIYINGIHLGEEAYAVVSIGVCKDGSKKVLDFEPGSSEMLTRLNARNLKLCTRPLFIFDGSASLRRAVKELYSNALIQPLLNSL